MLCMTRMSSARPLHGIRLQIHCIRSVRPLAMHVAQVVEAPDGGVLAEVQYMGQTAQFSPVQLLAMILVDEREIAVADGHPVTDCVVTVPVFYNEVDTVAS
jgi:molecular chaperone DnaK (HSP70)